MAHVRVCSSGFSRIFTHCVQGLRPAWRLHPGCWGHAECNSWTQFQSAAETAAHSQRAFGSTL